MSEIILIPNTNGSEATVAEYSPQIVPEYAGNPYIEALCPIKSPQQVAQQLTVYPPYTPEERRVENQYRLHFIKRLFHVFQPLPHHIELENRISTALRQGYLTRNPLKSQYAKSLQDGYRAIQNQKWQYGNNVNSTTLGFSLIGSSGIGKTTALNQILRNMPQVILHREYKRIKFIGYQITHLKLDCPMDGSIKGLCTDFFIKIDNLVGTEYYKKFGTSRKSTDSMIATMSQVCRHLGIGLLLVDELQNLSLAKSGGSEKMLNYFVSLNNIGIPLIMVGTPKTLSVLQGEFRLARRGDGDGSLFWDRLKKDYIWDLFLNGIWPYQWTKKETPLTQELSDALYDESQGIVDITVKLYAMAQTYAITTAKEEITTQIIRKVAAENLKISKPLLEALKTGNVRSLAQYEDVVTDIDFGSFFDRSQNKVEVDLRVKALQKQKEAKEKVEVLSIKEHAILKLIELNFQAKQVQKAVDVVLAKEETASVQELVVKAIEILTKKRKNKTIDKSNDTENEDDIRLIVQEGRKQKLTAYEALKIKGKIKPADQDLFMTG